MRDVLSLFSLSDGTTSGLFRFCLSPFFSVFELPATGAAAPCWLTTWLGRVSSLSAVSLSATSETGEQHVQKKWIHHEASMSSISRLYRSVHRLLDFFAPASTALVLLWRKIVSPCLAVCELPATGAAAPCWLTTWLGRVLSLSAVSLPATSETGEQHVQKKWIHHEASMSSISRLYRSVHRLLDFFAPASTALVLLWRKIVSPCLAVCELPATGAAAPCWLTTWLGRVLSLSAVSLPATSETGKQHVQKKINPSQSQYVVYQSPLSFCTPHAWFFSHRYLQL